jgi:hypothetical protein
MSANDMGDLGEAAAALEDLPPAVRCRRMLASTARRCGTRFDAILLWISP